MLARLVRDGLLISDGVGRGMVYFLPWLKRQGTMLFDHDSTSSLQPAPERIALDSTFIPPQLGDIPPQLGDIPPQLGDIPPQLGDIPPQLGDIPIGLPTLYLEWEQLDSNKQQELQTIALSISEFKRVRPEVLRTTILKLCEGRYLGRRVLAQLLNRNPDDLLKRTLNPLVEDQLLQPAFPSNSDPRQAYTTHHNAFDRFKDSQ
jgi:hypothetical protein